MRTLLRLTLLTLLIIPVLAQAQEADLGITKTGPEQSDADTDVSYTVTVTNFGPDDAPSVTVTDNIPTGMTFVSADFTGAPGFGCTDPGVGNGGQVVCTNASMTDGATAVFVFVFHIDAGAAPGTFFTNIATVDCPIDPSEENDSATATTVTPFPPQSDLFVQKLGPSAAGPDSDVTYSITVGNAGPDGTTTFVFDDTLPGDMTFVSLTQTSGPALVCTTPTAGSGGLISCTSTSFPAGATSTLTIVGHIPPATPSGTSYSNSASVSSKDSDPNSNNNSAITTLTVSATNLSVVKSGPGSAPAGDISYTITVSNAGPDTATAVELNDPLPPGTTFVSRSQNNGPTASCTQPSPGSNGTVNCSFVSLANGVSAQFTLVLHSGANNSITNTAFVSSQTFDTDSSDNQDSVTTTVSQIADVSIVKSGPMTVPAGTDITYTVAVTNDGPSNASTLSLTDILEPGLTFVSASAPAGWSCTTPAPGANGTITCTASTLAADASAAFTFVAHVPSSATVGSTVSNSAAVSSTTTDPDSNDLSSTTAATVTAALPTDLSITKSADDASVVIGDTVTYTIVVTNNGAGDSLDTTVTDTIPAGTTFQSVTTTQGSCSGTTTVTCTLGTLAPASGATITLAVTMPATPGSFVNSASVTNSNGDTNGVNNADTATVTSSAAAVVPIPALAPSMLLLLATAFALAGFAALRSR